MSSPDESLTSVSTKLPLIGVGLRDGVLTDIRVVPRGLACECLCIACERPLIAKKGDVRIHHFAHADGSDCGYAEETLAHLLAKKFLCVKKLLTLPPVYATPEEILYPYKDVAFSEVSLERCLGSIVPDVLASDSNGRKLLIEIAVTHESDQDKIRKIAALGISAVEIPFPNCDVLTFESARKIFEWTGAEKYWLFNAKAAERRSIIPEWSFDRLTADYLLNRARYAYFPKVPSH